MRRLHGQQPSLVALSPAEVTISGRARISEIEVSTPLTPSLRVSAAMAATGSHDRGRAPIGRRTNHECWRGMLPPGDHSAPHEHNRGPTTRVEIT